MNTHFVCFSHPVVESAKPPCLWRRSKIIIMMITLGVERVSREDWFSPSYNSSNCKSRDFSIKHNPDTLPPASSNLQRRQCHPTPVLLPGKSHGRRSLGGCSPRGRDVGHDWATSLSLLTFMHWRRKWQPTRVLAWRIPGTGEPGGLLSMGSHRVGHDWHDLAAAAGTVLIINSWQKNYLKELVTQKKRM